MGVSFGSRRVADEDHGHLLRRGGVVCHNPGIQWTSVLRVEKRSDVPKMEVVSALFVADEESEDLVVSHKRTMIGWSGPRERQHVLPYRTVQYSSRCDMGAVNDVNSSGLRI
jgi:hypothetical protein